LQALARGDAAGDLPTQESDLADLAGAAVMSVRAGHHAADLSVEAPENGIPFMGQPEGLRRICENLLENSIRHGREDGRAVLTVATDGTEATITCDDDGPGIPPADRLHVMGRFARGTDARGGGSGLGLALVEQQALLHGGRVVIGDSDLGGARVEVHLPIRA
ncbi:MAG: ATP-binding protein, partial [Actinomycetes bacterium]